jgi:glycerol uptake facilitator-like aquaporin
MTTVTNGDLMTMLEGDDSNDARGKSVVTSNWSPFDRDVHGVAWRALAGEFVGCAMLMVVVVGSGFAAQSLSPGDVGLELLENALAIGAGLFVIINIVAPVSGAHFNPVVSMVDAWIGTCSWFRAFIYLPFQFAGCITGTIVANLMFGHHWVSWSTHHRASTAHFFSEIIASAGLIFLVFALQRNGRKTLSAAAVGLYIFAACFATSSATFANPAVTVARAFSNSFTGIAPSSLPVYIAGQIIGGVCGAGLTLLLFPRPEVAAT